MLCCAALCCAVLCCGCDGGVPRAHTPALPSHGNDVLPTALWRRGRRRRNTQASDSKNRLGTKKKEEKEEVEEKKKKTKRRPTTSRNEEMKITGDKTDFTTEEKVEMDCGMCWGGSEVVEVESLVEQGEAQGHRAQ